MSTRFYARCTHGFLYDYKRLTRLATITGGAGADTIDVGIADGDDDTIIFSTAATNGLDTITNFETDANEDFLDVELLADGDVDSEADVAANAAQVAGVDERAYVFADGANGTGVEEILDYTDLTDVAAFLEAGITATEAHAYVALINDLVNDLVYVYNVDVSADTATDNRIDAGDLTLVAIVGVDNAALTAAANVVFTA